jgi:hypothetical protein
MIWKNKLAAAAHLLCFDKYFMSKHENFSAADQSAKLTTIKTLRLSDTLLKDIKAECEASDLDFSNFMRAAAVAMMKQRGARPQSKDSFAKVR